MKVCPCTSGRAPDKSCRISRASAWHQHQRVYYDAGVFYAQMSQLAPLHHCSRSDFTQRVEAHNDGIEHHCKVTPCVKRLYIPLSTRFAADLKNFLLVEVIQQLIQYRLSEKMCTFAHDLVIVFVQQLQNYQKGLTPQIGISPNLYFSKLTCPCIYAYACDEVLADNNN